MGRAGPGRMWEKTAVENGRSYWEDGKTRKVKI